VLGPSPLLVEVQSVVTVSLIRHHEPYIACPYADEFDRWPSTRFSTISAKIWNCEARTQDLADPLAAEVSHSSFLAASDVEWVIFHSSGRYVCSSCNLFFV